VDRFEGVVRRKPFAEGSKSERTAIFLVTPRREYVLRRQGANPFSDPTLEGLVGKRVSLVGTLHGYTTPSPTGRRSPVVATAARPAVKLVMKATHQLLIFDKN